jgi:hypothetical protein
MREPVSRKLRAAVGQVFAAEHPKPQHLLRRQLRVEPRREVSAGGLGADVHVPTLHAVIDDNSSDHARQPERGR